MFLWGPPCPPYSVLNSKRKKSGNPFLSVEGAVFLLGAKFIRSLPQLFGAPPAHTEAVTKPLVLLHFPVRARS